MWIVSDNIILSISTRKWTYFDENGITKGELLLLNIERMTLGKMNLHENAN